MKRLSFVIVIITAFALITRTQTPAAQPTDNDLAATGIEWHDWSPATFDLAKRQHKLILLHLGAGWCHWCHVMEHETYRNPDIVNLLKKNFVAIHVDQDSRPDLSNRYEDYGWPATILFDENAKELVKKQGYIPPKRMKSILEATIADPTPGPSVNNAPTISFNTSTALAPDLRADLEKRLLENYDPTHAGWGTIHKYLDADALEYTIAQSRTGDKSAALRARAALAATRKLLDPVWGGIYQYSTDGDWDHPHFEKIMSFQADALRTYALAYARWHDPADLAAAESIHKFLTTFLLSPDGAFFTSQDADVIPGQHSADYFALNDTNRRKIGIPRIDKHIYARENGWAIRGLIALHNTTGNPEYLAQARTAAQWIIAHRSLDQEGGFRHDDHDAAGPYLADTLAMAQALLALHQATADRTYLTAAQHALTFIDKNFRATAAGYTTAANTDTQQFDENIAVARLANLLYQYTGTDQYNQIAAHTMQYVTTSAIASAHAAAPTLLAGSEFGSDPLHLTIVGPMTDPAAAALHQTALQCGIPYIRIEWIDHSQGSPIRDDVDYPNLKKPAAFLCTFSTCSMPMTDPDKLRILIAKRTGASP